MLIAALLLGVQTAIIGSSRTVYEMSRDGMMIRQFGRLNRYGVPIGSMFWDAAVTLTLLIVFKDNVVNIVAASNVGYVVPFILVPVAWLRLRRLVPDHPRPFKLGKGFAVGAVLTVVYNVFLLLVAGPMWGTKVMITGGVILISFLPFYAVRRRLQLAAPGQPQWTPGVEGGRT
jgi:amino acid transporter